MARAGGAAVWRWRMPIVGGCAHVFRVRFGVARRWRCLVMPARKGRGEEVLVMYVAMLCKHVLPTLYPTMVDVRAGGMGKGEWRAFVPERPAERDPPPAWWAKPLDITVSKFAKITVHIALIIYNKIGIYCILCSRQSQKPRVRALLAGRLALGFISPN